MTAVVSVVNASTVPIRIASDGRQIVCHQTVSRRHPSLTRGVPAAAWQAWAALPGNAALVAAGLVYAVHSPAPVAS
jgi:hypothetical protein